MQNPEVQIMFYGKNIAQYQVEVAGQAKITDIVTTENPNYPFVTINIDKSPAGELRFSFKKIVKISLIPIFKRTPSRFLKAPRF
jgi:hypothetical protein